MGAGSIPPSSFNPGTAAVWVFNFIPRPANAPISTSWPPAGYVPASLVYDRWSYSYYNADFSKTTVSVTKNGVPLTVQQEALVGESSATNPVFVGDNTIVWEMPDNVVGLTDDETYAVHLANVGINGVPQDLDYTVTSVDTTWSKINVTAAVPIAHRDGPVAGRFKFTRNGDVSVAQTVSYRVSGTAVSGQEYTALTGSVTFQPGASSARVRVVPIAAAGAHGAGTVVVTVEPSEGYKLGAQTRATVKIKN
jgi:hypothetical protein